MHKSKSALEAFKIGRIWCQSVGIPECSFLVQQMQGKTLREYRAMSVS